MVSKRAIFVAIGLNIASTGLGVLVFYLMEPIETGGDLAWMFAVIGVVGLAFGSAGALLMLRVQRTEERRES